MCLAIDDYNCASVADIDEDAISLFVDLQCFRMRGDWDVCKHRQRLRVDHCDSGRICRICATMTHIEKPGVLVIDHVVRIFGELDGLDELKRGALEDIELAFLPVSRKQAFCG